jgi:Ni/Fe-hydrogenase subunit HybB-like protein
MRERGSPFWRGVFYLALAWGLTSTVVRITSGLGAVTNLSDEYPWGLWVGFDVLCGIGLAAGGFVITAVVHIFDLKRFRPIVRPAMLTAFLGYALVIFALLFDLGRPWNLWRPLIMWNPRSVMFEVAWCVTLYSSVLALECSGMVFEKLQWRRAMKVQRLLTIPLVIAGVVLSTLHQSSLGTLYLIVPDKLHALWYTPLLPTLFFVSSVSVGLAMVIVESRISSRATGRRLGMPLMSSLGRMLLAVLAAYAVLRMGDLWSRGALGHVFDLGYESTLFLVELVIGLVLPIGLLCSGRVRSSLRGLYVASLLVVLGFFSHRLNVSVTGFEAGKGGYYLPAWPEVGVTLMLVALGFAAFAFAERHLNLHPSADDEAPESSRDSAPQRPSALAPP